MTTTLEAGSTTAQRLKLLTTAELAAICQSAPRRWSSIDIAATCVLAERCGIECIYESAILCQIARCRRLSLYVRDLAIAKLVLMHDGLDNVPGIMMNNFIKNYYKRHPAQTEKPYTQN